MALFTDEIRKSAGNAGIKTFTSKLDQGLMADAVARGELHEIYDDWMQETTQRIIKLLGLLLPDLLVKKCSYQTSLRVL